MRGVHALHGFVTKPQPGTTSLANVQTSDIWRDSSAGGGSRSLDWRPDDQSQSVLIASTDGAALPALRRHASPGIAAAGSRRRCC